MDPLLVNVLLPLLATGATALGFLVSRRKGSSSYVTELQSEVADLRAKNRTLEEKVGQLFDENLRLYRTLYSKNGGSK